MRRSIISFSSVVALSVLVTSAIYAQRNFDTVQVRAVTLGDGIVMLTGSGGNIGVSSGEDGIFIIDDQFAPLTDKIKKAISDGTHSNAPVRFVMNTHWHGDHTGGNENFGTGGAVIVAHENVRKRMSVEHFNEMFKNKTAASPKAALPIITFTSDVNFHLNGDDIRVFHVEPAHTDGDAIVYIVKANIVHMGDIYFCSMYPFIDSSSGGSIDGVVAAVERVIPMLNEQTKVIPGHGPVSNLKELTAYYDMLVAVRDRIAGLIKEGKSLADVKAAKPTAEFDEKWGKGFMAPDQFVTIVYGLLSGKKGMK